MATDWTPRELRHSFVSLLSSSAVLPGDYVLLPGGSAKCDEFCQGFSDRQFSLMENSRAAQYRQNLRTYREQAASGQRAGPAGRACRVSA